MTNSVCPKCRSIYRKDQEPTTWDVIRVVVVGLAGLLLAFILLFAFICWILFPVVLFILCQSPVAICA
jgi:hypothetical protein